MSEPDGSMTGSSGNEVEVFFHTKQIHRLVGSHRYGTGWPCTSAGHRPTGEHAESRPRGFANRDRFTITHRRIV